MNKEDILNKTNLAWVVIVLVGVIILWNMGILRRGSQVNGAGQAFETVYDIDFASPISGDGFPNRLKIPNFDSNNKLINYTIVKRETVVNGVTKVFKKVITPNDVKPFYEVFLPDKNVLGVTSVLLKDGTQYGNVPSNQEFLGLDNRWYEVKALAEDRVFVEDPTKVSDSPGIKVGKYLLPFLVNNKCIKSVLVSSVLSVERSKYFPS